MNKKPKLYLIDASGFLFRAYHALPPLNRADGTPVGAVYGFVNMLTKLLDGANADYVGVIFDAARKTFRHDIYDKYKANRPPAPEDLIPQFALVREATEAMNLPVVELENYEADDLIATYAKQGHAMGMEVVIVSSDKDLMQLVGGDVSMFDAMKNKEIGPEQVKEKFGVAPDKVLDVLSLIGDSSDNVPGVPGIGPKTAAELIMQYGDLDTLLARASEIKQNKRRENIIEHTEQAKLSRQLITLCDTVPLPKPIEDFAVRDAEPEKLLTFARAQNFKSLVAKIEQKFGVKAADVPAPVAAPIAATPKAPDNVEYTLVTDEATLVQWIEKASRTGRVAFDTETTSLDAMVAEVVGFSLSVEPGKACYVPLAHMEKTEGDAPQEDLFAAAQPSTVLRRVKGQIDPARALELLNPLLTDPAVLKVGQNIKYDMLVLKKYGIDIAPIDDTMLMSYVLGAGLHPHNMDDLAERYLGHKTIAYSDVTGSGRQKITFAEVALEKARDYAAEDADITLRLADALKPQVIAEHLLSVYETIERPLVPVLVDMEARGVKVDSTILSDLSNDFATRIAALEKEIHQIAGKEFNIGSPKQLGEILFDELKLEGGKKSSKSGQYSTDAEVMEELASVHPLPAKVLEWRQLSKLKSTYTDALQQSINKETGRVHTSFAMAVASTGRLSSSDPNLQNIPIRTEDGRKIRTAFVAEEGCTLISADYSQIELRLLAHVADIVPLKEAFREGRDIHAATASQMFGVSESDVTSDLRRNAKTINFGIIYGISAFGLAARLGIGRTEAKEYIDKYFEQYPGIRDYMESAKEFARKHGYVETLFGRRCHVPGIHDKNPNRRNFSERAAINAPLQGTAADIIKRAMITLDGDLRMRFASGREQSGASEVYQETSMILQVHDELVLEAPEAQAQEAAALTKKVMEGAASLSVPLVVEVGVGRSWGGMK